MSFIGKWLAVVAVVFVKLLWDLAYTVYEGFWANSGGENCGGGANSLTCGRNSVKYNGFMKNGICESQLSVKFFACELCLLMN